nr:hypothetical protein [Pirellula staleyi]
MALAGKTDFRCHFNNRTPSTQKFPRTFDPATNNVLAWSLSGGRLEQPGEMKSASSHNGRQVFQREWRVEVPNDVLIQTGQLFIREPGRSFVRLGAVGVLTAQMNAEGGSE